MSDGPNDLTDGMPVEAAASIALNKKTPPIHEAPYIMPDGSFSANSRGSIGVRGVHGPGPHDKGTPGTPPDYGVPAEVPAIKCYLCSYGFPADAKINWRGHWICPGCLEKESRKEESMVTIPTPENDFHTSPLMRETTAHAILHKAISTITQRGKDYNKPGGERSMKATVEAFNAITGHNLTVVEGWKFMEVLKMVRAQHSPHRIDNFLDGCAYAALAGEEALNSQNK